LFSRSQFEKKEKCWFPAGKRRFSAELRIDTEE